MKHTIFALLFLPVIALAQPADLEWTLMAQPSTTACGEIVYAAHQVTDGEEVGRVVCEEQKRTWVASYNLPGGEIKCHLGGFNSLESAQEAVRVNHAFYHGIDPVLHGTKLTFEPRYRTRKTCRWRSARGLFDTERVGIEE